jgi:hypothetical protein
MHDGKTGNFRRVPDDEERYRALTRTASTLQYNEPVLLLSPFRPVSRHKAFSLLASLVGRLSCVTSAAAPWFSAVLGLSSLVHATWLLHPPIPWTNATPPGTEDK